MFMLFWKVSRIQPSIPSHFEFLLVNYEVKRKTQKTKEFRMINRSKPSFLWLHLA